jgi:glycosyltransferase involved in cell wall biosynthesis
VPLRLTMSSAEADFLSNDSRIVFVFHRGDVIGGASIYIMHLARALAEAGHGVHVIVAGEGHFASLLASSGLSWSAIPAAGRAMGASTAWRGARLIPKLRKELDRLRPTLVSAQGAQAGLFVRALRRQLGCPIVYTPHGWSFMPGAGAKNQFGGRMIEWALRGRSTATIAVSNYEADVGRRSRTVAPGTLHVIHNGIPDLARTAAARVANGESDCIEFVSVARFERQKNHEALVEAVNRIRNLPFRVALFGEGELEAGVRAHIARLALDEHFVFKGTTNDIATELANADVFVLSSRWESFPLSILEAMSASCAVIATDVGGVAEAIDHGRNGLLVPPDDVDALARAMRSLIEDQPLRKRLGATARKDFESRFQLESMTKPTIDLYAELEAAGRRNS